MNHRTLHKIGRLLVLLLIVTQTCCITQAQPDSKTVVIKVNLNEVKGPMTPIWAWFGYDEPNYTYMKDGCKLLSEIAALSPVPVYVRTHSLLCTGDGIPALKWGSTNAYTEDAQGNAIYNWHIIDSIFDTYVQRGMKPLAQIGFMPKALSSHPEPYQHDWKPGEPYSKIFTGWAYPPKDYHKWEELVYRWVKHSVDRYGKKEVESWYWEVWNEPNGYWKGTQDEYLQLYDYAANGVKRALPTARIGGLNIAGTSSPGALAFLNKFIRHCLYDTNYATGKKGAPLDAILFHAKGQPSIRDGVVWMNMSPQLRDIEAGIRTALSYPETKSLPLIVGESDPEGCAACGMATNPSNGYRNGTMYSSYTAASFAREYELKDKYQANLVGAVSWSFEFENQPWFYGFRDLATNGVDKPVLNVFRMFGMMKGQRVTALSERMVPLQTVLDSSVRSETDIGAMATTHKNEAAVMIWNYHDQDKKAGAEQIEVQINQVTAARVTATEYRIDDTHSNSYETWKQMGSPLQPSPAQVATLEKSGQLQTAGKVIVLPVAAGSVRLRISLPRQGVSLLKLNW